MIPLSFVNTQVTFYPVASHLLRGSTMSDAFPMSPTKGHYSLLAFAPHGCIHASMGPSQGLHKPDVMLRAGVWKGSFLG